MILLKRIHFSKFMIQEMYEIVYDNKMNIYKAYMFSSVVG